MDSLNIFLSKNNIKKSFFNKVIYECLFLNVFEKIFNYLEQGNNRIKFVKKFRCCNSKKSEILFLENLIKEIVGVNLTQKELDRIMDLMNAYLRKNNTRKSIENNEKKRILKQSNLRCSICNKKISLEDYHMDHIIPFRYVGDELSNNFQSLCDRCNWEKSYNLYYLFDRIIKSKKKK